MHPITQRRFNQFKRNKRAYGSFIIFAGLFLLTLAANFLANEKPLLVKFDGHYYFPMITDYPETTFGGSFESYTNYRDNDIQDIINERGWIIFPLLPFSPSTIDYQLTQSAPSPPSGNHFFGTDDQGRDVLVRLLYGFRTSILFGLLLTATASLIGIFMGALQGYFGGKIDLFMQRFVEVWSGLPILFLLIILSSLIEPSFGWLLCIMALFSWMPLVGVVRAEFLRARNLEYIRAAEALGVPNRRIILRHILPNAMIATITYLPFVLNTAIVTLTSLDFLGFGLPPGTASLGEIVTQAKNNIHAPWIGLTAFFSISCLLTLLIFIGEGVRDCFDPRK